MGDDGDDDGDDDTGEGAEGFLCGQCLIAMPHMPDPNFKRSVVYLCAHSETGAVGLILNRPADELTLGDLFSKLSIDLPDKIQHEAIRFGGPVETGRGFVLHSADYYVPEATLKVDESVSMTATVEILRAIARDNGPEDRFVALGYAGWAPGQLENEIRENGWLACEPDRELLFGEMHDDKWDRALGKLGISAALLSGGGSA
ncbi:MAG: YqgE/AlgH family protein [Pseudomonadota bacterium]